MKTQEITTNKKKKQLYIKTFGCQMNVYDSARMKDVLSPLGYEPSDQPEGADMVILNTCHIREKATEKLFSDLGRLKPLKDEKEKVGEDMILAVAGCVAQAEGKEITRRAPYVDMVFGPQVYHRLPEMVARATRAAAEKKPRQVRGAGVIDTEFPLESKFDKLPEEAVSQGAAAFLSIQEGCDKFCTFCVVPYTRGAETSRPLESVLEEAKRLLKNGAKELTLLGQNVNAYHGEGKNGREVDFAELLYHVAELEGLERLRYTTSHPREFTPELIKAHGDIDVMMPYLHLPVQAGSDRVLEAMNRKYTGDEYKRIIEELRAVRPDIALSSDFIVGFPGESEKDFQATMKLVEDVVFSQSYSFKYSPRPGTPGALMDLHVDEDVKSRRLAELQAVLNQQQVDFNAAYVGKTLPVLLDRRGKGESQLLGRSPYMHSVYVNAPSRLFGQIVDVKIESAGPNSLTGSIVTGEYSGSEHLKMEG